MTEGHYVHTSQMKKLHMKNEDLSVQDTMRITELLKDRKCLRCGEDISKRHCNARYCFDCTDIPQLSWRKRAELAEKENKTLREELNELMTKKEGKQ
jgi:hypothetical protein